MKKKSLRKILQNERRQNRGITLIALVITIVVLIILATITINFAFGENGLVSMTEDAREITTEATEKEGIEMAVADSKIKDITTPNREKENLKESLRSQFGNDANFTVTENGDGSFLINMNDSQRSYYVESTGEIIAQSEWIEIGTEEELKAFRDEVNSGNTFEGKYIRLTSNITLDIGEEWEPIGLYPNESSTPDNENNKPFSGTFDGCGYEIDGIYINTTDKCQGLFGIVNNGNILNLGIGENCNISGGIGRAGLVSYLYNGSVVSGCYNEANITGGGYSGGLVGICRLNSIIQDCYNLGDVTSEDHSGGICGQVETAQIYNCYNEGNISSSGNYVGGIAGMALGGDCVIDQCFNKGQANGNENVGGISGYLGNNCKGIKNCYNIGIVTGKNYAGGIIGKNDGKINSSYNKGSVSGEGRVGGIVGINNSYSNIYGIITNCYSLDSACKDLCGVNGYWGEVEAIIENSSLKTEQEMKSLAPTLGSAFKDDYEEESVNDGYPILSWQ